MYAEGGTKIRRSCKYSLGIGSRLDRVWIGCRSHLVRVLDVWQVVCDEESEDPVTGMQTAKFLRPLPVDGLMDRWSGCQWRGDALGSRKSRG